MQNSQCTIVERALRAYLNRDEITWFCLQIDPNLVLHKRSAGVHGGYPLCTPFCAMHRNIYHDRIPVDLYRLPKTY